MFIRLILEVALEGVFDDGASEHVYLEDYELDTSIQATNDHISWAFGTNATILMVS